MKQTPQASEPTISRLAYYLRAVSHLAAEGSILVSSQALATRLGVSSAQVRKDLSCFGEFGTQGQGYPVLALRDQLLAILHVDDLWPVVVVGAGKVGQALAGYDGLRTRGFRITALFDNDVDKIGHAVGKLRIRSTGGMKNYLQYHGIELAILTVSVDQAQAVAEQLVTAGVRAILNYTPLDLNLPAAMMVENVDPVIHLQRMTFRLRQPSWSLANNVAEMHGGDNEVVSKMPSQCIVPITRPQPALPLIHNGVV